MTATTQQLRDQYAAHRAAARALGFTANFRDNCIALADRAPRTPAEWVQAAGRVVAMEEACKAWQDQAEADYQAAKARIEAELEARDTSWSEDCDGEYETFEDYVCARMRQDEMDDYEPEGPGITEPWEVAYGPRDDNPMEVNWEAPY